MTLAGALGWRLGGRARPAAAFGFAALLLASVALLSWAAPGLVQSYSFGLSFEGSYLTAILMQRARGIVALTAVAFVLTSVGRATFGVQRAANLANRDDGPRRVRQPSPSAAG